MPDRIDRRQALAVIASVAGVAATPAMARPQWDIIVSRRRSGSVATLGQALALAQAANRPFRIFIDEGVFEEKLTIAVPDLTIGGTGRESILSFGAASGHKRPDGERWGTSGSASITVNAPGVTLQDLTVRNSFDYIGDRRSGGNGGPQAVALAFARSADRARAERCHFEGFQDTLLVQSRAFFRDCVISGNIDFIFGGGASLFRRCEIVTRHVPGAQGGGYLAAPSTREKQAFGFVFDRCRITREAGVADHSTYLGRPWRAGGNMDLLGSATFIHCHLDRHIHPDGWTSMGFTDPQGIKRQLQPEEARLSEYQSSGPGAGSASLKRRMLTQAEDAAFTDRNILSGWAP